MPPGSYGEECWQDYVFRRVWEEKRDRMSECAQQVNGPSVKESRVKVMISLKACFVLLPWQRFLNFCWLCCCRGSDPAGQTFRTIDSESPRASDPLCLNRGSRLKGQSPCCFSETFSNRENRRRLHQERHQSPLSRSQISTVGFFFPCQPTDTLSSFFSP